MTAITCIGECMVEMSPTDAPDAYHMGFAGDTLNTAWYLRRLLGDDHRVDYLSAVGTDALSARMMDFLRAAGLGVDHVARRADRTIGLYLIQLTDGERSFSYWRDTSAARTLASDAAALDRALRGTGIAYFSGITLAILPPPDRRRLLDALRDVRSRGGAAVFDPNLRPRLWDGPDAMTAAVMEAAAISDTVLPSFDDEATWFGDSDPEATARRYADAGARTVIVKNGAAEMLALEAGRLSRHGPGNPARIVDTTAAGDSFNAGYLASRIDGQCLAESIRAAADLAARVIGARGALVPLDP